MNPFDKVEDPRRRWLVQALSAGFFSAGLPAASALAAGILGTRPSRLPEGQSVYFISGRATVNGQEANIKTRVSPGDTVQTGPNSEMIFAVNGSAMILRGDSNLVIEAEKAPAPAAMGVPRAIRVADSSGAAAAASVVISGLRLLTGKLLSVSRNRPMRVTTSTATIGIRGTGWYAESDPDQTYFCTCYGVTEIASTADPESRETIAAQHHDRPVYIAGKAAAGRSIRNAPFINHTDQELTLIETLVGRTPPFVFMNDTYNAPRRDY